MNVRSRTAPLAALIAVGAFVLPAGALAKGGSSGGGGGTAATPPPSNVVECDYSLDGQLPDGGAVFSNQVGDAGCLSVVSRTSGIRLYNVALTPGWTYTAETTSTGVRVNFTETATGRTASARIEPGKTDIRG